jgi:hypothetical protein
VPSLLFQNSDGTLLNRQVSVGLRTDAIHVRDLKPISWQANELKSWRYAKDKNNKDWSPGAKEKLFAVQ